jgi:hypothetical protein
VWAKIGISLFTPSLLVHGEGKYSFVQVFLVPVTALSLILPVSLRQQPWWLGFALPTPAITAHSIRRKHVLTIRRKHVSIPRSAAALHPRSRVHAARCPSTISIAGNLSVLPLHPSAATFSPAAKKKKEQPLYPCHREAARTGLTIHTARKQPSRPRPSPSSKKHPHRPNFPLQGKIKLICYVLYYAICYVLASNS